MNLINAPYHYTATLQLLMIGFGNGWVMPTITRYKNSDGDFSLTDEECSWIASLHYLGRLAGSVLASATMDRIGRVWLIVMASVLGVLVWIWVAVTRMVLLHYAIRLAFGLAVGFLDTTLPIYIAENSSPNLRAVFGTTISLFFFGGIIMAVAVVSYLSYLLAATIAACLALVSLSLLLLLQQPAQYLLMKGDEKRARIQFQWLRGQDKDVDGEFDEMKAQLSSVKAEFSPRMFLDPQVRIVCWIHILAFLTGFPSINSFLTTVLEPVSSYSRVDLAIFYGIAQFGGAAFATTFIESFGRRTLWMAATIISIAAHSTAAVLHYCLANDIPVPALAWLLFAAVVTYGATYGSLVHSLMSTTRGELLPPKYKAAGVCAGIIVNSLVAFGTTHVFTITALTFGVASVFTFYSASNLLLLIYVYFYVPETKGLTLVEIQKLFET